MRVRLTVGWLLVLSLLAAIGSAQQPPAPPARSLSMAEALEIAQRNNPEFLATRNDRWSVQRQLLNATSNLFLPTAQVSGTYYAQQSGEQNLFGQPFQVPGLNQRSWSFGMNYRFSGSTLANRGLYRAQRDAADEDIDGARTQLATYVRTAYLNVLQAQAQEELARRSVERANENLSLAQARYSVGQGTLIDVRRAEVDKGQAEVGVLRSQQTTENQTLALFQRLGVPAPAPARVLLTDSLPVVEPRYEVDALVAMALEANPGVRALRARRRAAGWGVRSARSQYLPSLFMSASYGKYRTQRDTVITTGTNPWNFAATISLPLYDGFQRSVQTAQARAQQDDLDQSLRARELQLRAEVTGAMYAVVTAWRTIDIQRRNLGASSEALELATQRYRVGSGTYIELLDARVAAERAAAEYVGAVYEYHRSMAALENAVGRTLR